MSDIASVPLSEDQRRFVETLVEQGEYESLGQVVTAGIERLRAEHAERASAMDGIAEELRRRAATPDKEFLPIETLDTDKIVEQAIKRRALRSS